MDTKYISVDSFIRDVLATTDDPGADGYVKMLRITVRVLEDLQRMVTTVPRSFVGVVEDNLTLPMPQDCKEPIFAVRLVKTTDDKGATIESSWPLGKKPDRNLSKRYTFINQSRFDCSEVPDSIDGSLLTTAFPFYNLQGTNYSPYWIYYNPWYFGEMYGYRQDYVWGYWDYDEGGNRLVFDSGGVVRPGVNVAVEYISTIINDMDRVIERGYFNFYRARVLQLFYEGSRPQQSLYFLNQFRRELSMVKRDKLGKFSYDDYVNAFARGYRSAPR